MKNVKRVLACGVASCLFLSMISCSPEDVVHYYFKQLGLNQLAIVRDELKAGAFIQVKGNDAIYDDSLLEYVESPDGADITVTALGKTDDYNAVLRQYKEDRSVDGKVAMSFVKSVLPVDPSADLGITTDVTIDLVNAKAERMSPAAINRFLKNRASIVFRQHLQELDSSVSPFLAYEVYKANKLKITAKGGKNINAALKVGEVKPLGSADASFSYKKTFDDTIEISGDHYYVFAIRAGKIVSKNGVYLMDITTYSLPGSWGVKAAGTEAEFSAPLVGDYAAVKIGNKARQ